MKDNTWKGIFFITLSISIMFFILVGIKPESNNQRIDGVYVKYYWDLDDGTRVYYNGFIPYQGIGEFNLIMICDEILQQCREPNPEEIKQDKYILQSPLN